MAANIFKNEYKVRKIGGRLNDDYLSFRSWILGINENYIPLFFMMGFNKPDDKDLIIDALLCNTFVEITAKKVYISHMTQKVEDGELKIESLLTQRSIDKVLPTPEEKKVQIDRDIHRSLVYRFNDIYKAYVKKYKPSSFGFNRSALRVFRESLSLTDLGFSIDIDKFIDIYKGYIKASESKIGEQHRMAAEAINKFFNGSMEITQAELERYFIIDSGIVRPNPNSINIDDYMRVGFR